ncbi:MAG: class II fructose-bisphosphate aldolase family protein [Candidatus Pacebacteria bacterium]|nr:class II fructose-bisphosphate aldolase family protein [Candidatus Paceibacterota bacterium]
MNLKEIIREAGNKKTAIGHFNISDLVALKAIFESAQELNVPVIIGTSEGEAGFVDIEQTAALIKSLRQEHNFPIFLNADHFHSLEGIKKAVAAGYDAVLFDAGKLPIEENIKKTKEVVDYVRSVNPNILIEGELGYIGTSSKIFEGVPEGVSIKPEDLTTQEQAERFVKETGVDLLAPAVGNIHGIISSGNPNLDIERIKQICKTAGASIVLHGGSGISDKDFISAIEAGVSIIHINTELRIAWRKGVEEGLAENPKEVAPYKILPEAVEEIKKVVRARLKLFNKLV